MKGVSRLSKYLHLFYILYSISVFVLSSVFTLVSLHSSEDGLFESKIKNVVKKTRNTVANAQKRPPLKYGIVNFSDVNGLDFTHVDSKQADFIYVEPGDAGPNKDNKIVFIKGIGYCLKEQKPK